MKVLLIEDEIKLAKATKYLFKEQKIDCDIISNGKEGYKKALECFYNVIILDVMLPDMNGYEILDNLRKDNVKTPIIMLTAKSQLADKVQGLNLGADDYLTKPFEFDELLARIYALSRRGEALIMNEITFGDLVFNTISGEISCNNETIKLNYKEKEILKILFSSNIISKEQLIDKVWGWDSEATDNNVEAYISFIRKKLKFLNSCVCIKNYQKFGYKMEVTSDKNS